MIAREFTHNVLLLLYTAAFLAQCLIDHSLLNLACACIIYGSTVVCLLYLRWTPAIDSYPLSSMAILGFNVVGQSGALLFQSAALTAVSLNLRQPLLTFSVLAAAQAGAIVMHAMYRWWRQPDQQPAPRKSRAGMLERMGLYAVPTVGALWWLGVAGLLGLLMSKIGFLYQVGNGMSFLVIAPFLIPVFRNRIGPEYGSAMLHYAWLVVFAVAIGVVAIAANTRGIMLRGGITIVLIALLELLRSRGLVQPRHLWRTGFALLVCWGLSYPVAYLADAMVVVRDERIYASKVEMLRKTMDAVMRPNAIQSLREKRLMEVRGNYDERYIDNPLLARFSETKFHDNAMYFGIHMREDDVERLGEATRNFLWGILPQPVLDLLTVDVDKMDQRFSLGDFLANSAGKHSLGSYATGSVFGQGIALFGFGFSIVYLLLCPLLFYCIDLFSRVRPDGIGYASVAGMLMVWTNFQYGITAESFHQMLGGVLRGVLQTILIYVVVYKIAAFLGQAKARRPSMNRFAPPAGQRRLHVA